MTEPAPSTPRGLAYSVLDEELAICRLDAGARIPPWARKGSFWSLSGSADEMSVVCAAEGVPKTIKKNEGWRGLKIEGPLDQPVIGVLEAFARALSTQGISLFAVSTFDADYVLVRDKNLAKAVKVLRRAGHCLSRPVSDEAEAAALTAAEAEGLAEAQSAGTRQIREADPGSEEKEGSTKPRRRRRRRSRSKGSTEGEVVAPAEESKASDQVAGTAPPEGDGDEAPAVDEAASTDNEREEREPPRKHRARRGSRDERDDDDGGPEDVSSEGLYTGAIAQAPLETTQETFEGLGLSGPILETISEIGFEHPTPIQVKAIPSALEGNDVIGLAQTGSGKTAAFSLPLAEALTHGKGVRGLILCPTREIALQTKAFLEIFGHDHALETAVVIGGVPMGPQIKHLARHPDIIVATPGRLADHVRRGNVSLGKVEKLVLDEADHMLDLGFLPQIQEILESLPEKRQTMMFSATMPPPIARLAKRFMADPVTIDFRPEGGTAEGIEHRLYLVREEDRKDCLFSILREVPGTTLIFLRRKIRTEWMARLLEEGGFTADRIHSDRSQAQRVDALRGFRSGQHRILVATDVAARGIDVPAIRHVINFGPPEQIEDYVHRAGRTARGSNDGIVSTIATALEKGSIKEIELEIGQKLQRCTAEGVEPWREMKVKKRIRRRLL